MIPAINLMPPECQRARLARRRVRQWASVVGLAVSTVLPVAALLHTSVDASLSRRQDQIIAREQASAAAVGSLEARLEELSHQQRVSDLLAARPQFTLLVNAVAGAVGDSIAVESMSVVGSQSDDTTERSLSIEGLAQSQLGAQQLAVRLEDLGVFTSVTLADTRRRSTPVGELVAFRVHAVLRGGSS